ncbi:hypothetical protein LGM43_26935 [Burkholderia seminalis]|uniref:DUF6941 family protein n=1 Tax=Burkholderia seminalis TaxID=488731 RepID=UPI001CF3975D|nr:hypothetical protein [Burkholderia seminalis]MCA7953910.1 hypothetical protein [Burkholderia seminalis]
MTRYPEESDITFLLADDVRVEADPSKFTLIGLLPTLMIKVPLQNGGDQQPSMFPSLSVMLVMNRVLGDFDIRVDFVDPDGQSIIPEENSRRHANATEDNQTLAFVFNFRPFTVKLGEFSLTVHLNNRNYVRTFSIVSGAAS